MYIEGGQGACPLKLKNFDNFKSPVDQFHTFQVSKYGSFYTIHIFGLDPSAHVSIFVSAGHRCSYSKRTQTISGGCTACYLSFKVLLIVSINKDNYHIICLFYYLFSL